jgi:predicted glycosyltransferase
MEYTKIDPDEVGNKVLLDRALLLDRHAYSSELEIVRLTDLQEAVEIDLSEQIDTANADAISRRRKAERSKIGLQVTQEDIRVSRLAFISEWIENIEKDNAIYSAIAMAAKNELEDDDLTEDEKTTLQAELDQALTNLDIIDVSHKIAIDQYGTLNL